MKTRTLAVLVFLAAEFGLAQTYEVVQQFTGIGDPINDRLIEGPGGVLYGAVADGGLYNHGSIFSATPDAAAGRRFAVVHAFSGPDGRFPVGAPLPAADGSLYGTTQLGGANDQGTVYRVDPSGTLTVLHNFDGTDGSHPTSDLLQAPDGTFYGTTFDGGTGHGTVFRMDSSGALLGVHAFDGTDGEHPYGALILLSDGYFYGTTTGGGTGGRGTLFRMDADCNVTTLHDFSGPDGASPGKHLVQGTDGRIYGVTSAGGGQDGTVFAFDLVTGTLTTLHSLSYGPDGSGPVGGLVQAPDGWFYGTAAAGSLAAPDGAPIGGGTLFKVDASGNFVVVQRYSNLGPNTPFAVPMLDSSGVIWASQSKDGGTPLGPNGGGIFNLSGEYYEIAGAGVGRQPMGSLVQASDGNFYVTTEYGGSREYGTVSRSDASLTILSDLAPPAPLNPVAPLVQASAGLLYGTSYKGGQPNFGTVFTISLSGVPQVLHEFDSANGFPTAPVLEASDGFFYGTTNGSAGSFLGTLFRIDGAGLFATLYAFDGSQGDSPYAGLIQALDGKIYGTALSGGSGHGTIFRLDGPGSVTAIHAFNGTDGDGPWGRLIQDTDGTFYGTTMQGGANGRGTVFKIDTAGTLTTLHDFGDGAYPHAGLIKAPDGNFYGTTSAGGISELGTVFKMDALGNLDTLHAFNGVNDGADPEDGLIEGSDGRLYGTTAAGGATGRGTIYRIGWSLALELDAIRPTSGRAAGGASLTVLGDNFSDGATVTIGGLAALVPGDPGLRLQIPVVAPLLPPGTLNDVTVTNADTSTATLPGAWLADFVDVPRGDIFHDYVETIFRNGITAGCGGGLYCRNGAVSREQMAVFLLKSIHGSSYTPPACQGAFADVPCPSQFADWIEQLAVEGITGGCGNGNYCPASPVRRDQMAAFLLKAEHGASYVSPPCAGLFGDVACPSLFADWIEQLAVEQITGGCGGGNYCPGNANTRGQMAVFLVKTFGLQ